jgi:hypothetical protein
MENVPVANCILTMSIVLQFGGWGQIIFCVLNRAGGFAEPTQTFSPYSSIPVLVSYLATKALIWVLNSEAKFANTFICTLSAVSSSFFASIARSKPAADVGAGSSLGSRKKDTFGSSAVGKGASNKSTRKCESNRIGLGQMNVVHF